MDEALVVEVPGPGQILEVAVPIQAYADTQQAQVLVVSEPGDAQVLVIEVPTSALATPLQAVEVLQVQADPVDIQLLEVAAQGPAGPSGPTGAQGAPGDLQYLQAANDIIAYKLITTDASGAAVYHSAGTLAHAGRLVGVAVTSALTGAQLTVAHAGAITNTGWNWTPGALLYAGLNGDIVTTQVGVFSQAVGFAETPTKISLRVGPAFLRG